MGHLLSLIPATTTQTCSYFGFIMGTDKIKKLALRDREWTCPHTFVIGMQLKTFWQKA